MFGMIDGDVPSRSADAPALLSPPRTLSWAVEGHVTGGIVCAITNYAPDAAVSLKYPDRVDTPVLY